MLIPQQLTPWDYSGDKTNTNTGAYLSVYVNIQTSEGTPIFPAVEEGETEPYSWVAVPVDTNWEAGIKYVYTLDFTGGAGVIDPDEERTSSLNLIRLQDGLRPHIIKNLEKHHRDTQSDLAFWISVS